MSEDATMSILVCGSLSYDTIMTFNDEFSNHVLPEHIEILNLAFNASTLRKEYGGCAGNICYNLNLLECDAKPVSTVGEDFGRYEKRMKEKNLSSSFIKKIDDTYTAQSFITTDLSGNQVSTFYAGAMRESKQIMLPKVIDDPSKIKLGVISPDDIRGIISHAQQFHDLKIPFLFDPGQEIPSLNEHQLRDLVELANWMILNEYEWQMFTNKTRMSISDAVAQLDALIITKGINGSHLYSKDISFHTEIVSLGEVVDPTGCGDAYRAGIIFGITNNLEWKPTLQAASLMGALSVTQSGAQNHSITLKVFREKYSELFNTDL